jgi:hypothetical protein
MERVRTIRHARDVEPFSGAPMSTCANVRQVIQISRKGDVCRVDTSARNVRFCISLIRANSSEGEGAKLPV